MSKESALAKHLDIDEDEIVERYSNNFEVNPHTRLVGTSPAKAEQLVKQLFNALDLTMTRGAFIRLEDRWTYPKVRDAGYKDLEARLRADERAAETLKVGLHEVLNTLYFLCPESDDEKHAVDHRDTLREAADGLPIQDRRKSQDADDGEYLVLTDDEADEMWDEQLDSYLDECVLPELPEMARNYFDTTSLEARRPHRWPGTLPFG